jgi:hypothetical protein
VQSEIKSLDGMTWKGTNWTLKKLEQLEDKFRKMYQEISVNDDVCFMLNDGMVISLALFKKFNAVVIEYAKNIEDAKKNIFDDGDLFYFEDYKNEDEMLEAMIREIES